FIGWDADHGSELWAKDSGTSALLRDFFLGTDNPPITVVRTEAGRVFFNVGWSNFNIPPPANVGLWVTDGTVAGTVQLSTSPALSLVESGSVLIGSTIDAFNSGTPHIFQTDGTVAGTSLITSQTNEGIGFFSAYLRASGGKIFAIATTSQYGSELFRLNAKPVLAGSVAALTGATWNQPFTFSGSALAGLTASDADSASVQLRITSLLAGTLTVNGVAVAPGTTVISVGDTITFTPPANAHGTTPVFTVRAFDGDSFSESAATVRVQITSPYEQWLEANSFPTAEAHNTALTGPTMDSDGDGVPNGVEYLLGTAPASKDFAPYTTDVATDAQNKRHPRIVLQRAHPLPQGATLIIEETANLTDWTVIATHNGTAWTGTAIVTEDPPSGGSARVTVLSATELSDTAPVCFLRLRAVVP
ncbi:MAG: hypothetical protein ABIP20_01420, partial [Chthoniobacteraceae bacterium]